MKKILNAYCDACDMRTGHEVVLVDQKTSDQRYAWRCTECDSENYAEGYDGDPEDADYEDLFDYGIE